MSRGTPGAHSGGVLIDLGEVRHGGQFSAVPPPDVLLPVRRRRPGGLVVTVLVLLLTMVGAAPAPAALAASTIPAAAEDLVLGDHDRYFVVHPGRGPLGGRAGTRVVSAYDLPSTRLRWERPLPVGRPGWLTTLGSDTLLYLTVADPPAGRDLFTVTESTGRVWWRRGAQMVGVLPGGGALVWTSSSGDFGIGAGGQTLVAMAPATGDIRWTYDVPDGAWVWWDAADGGNTGLLVLFASGRMEVRDPRTAELTAAADLLSPRSVALAPEPVQIVADLVLVSGASSVTAFGRQRLDRRWTADIDLATEYVVACGTGLCVGGTRGGIRVLDPATGRLRWASDRWSFAESAGTRMVAGPADSLVGGAPATNGLVVLEARTGAVLTNLGYWSVAWPASLAAPLIGLRHGVGGSPTRVAHLDPVTGTARSLGAISGVSNDCLAGVGYLACRRRDGTVGVWRLRLR